MMRAMLVVLGACNLAMSGCGSGDVAGDVVPTETAAPANEVRMDAEAQTRMGVQTQPVVASTAPQTAEGFARVMDVGSLAAIESEVSTAVAAASASDEEYRRLVALAAQDQAASARSVEAARAQAAADGARVKLAARRIGLEWGAGLEKMSNGERSRLLSDIAAGRTALLRIDAPSVTAKIARVSVRLDKDSAAIPSTLIGQAAAADARLQTAGLLALVRGDAAATLAAGRLMQAELELGAEEQGFLLPEGALIRADGSILAYVKTGADTFERRDIADGHAVAGGWFVADGFAVGDQLVTGGASSVFAAEAGPVEAE